MFAFSALEQTFTIGNIGNIGIFTAQTIQRVAFVLCFHGMNIIWFLNGAGWGANINRGAGRIQVNANELKTFLKDHEQ